MSKITKTQFFWRRHQYDLIHAFIAWWFAVLQLELLSIASHITGVELLHFLKFYLLVSTPFIFTMSVVFMLINLYFEREYFRKRPYGVMIGLRTITHFLIFLFIYSFAQMENSPLQQVETFRHSLLGASKKGFVIGAIYFLITSFAINFMRQVRHKFGARVLQDMLLGKYHQPKTEERAFMFLDLKSSTHLTEILGHQKYSSLIKSCFYDLTDVVLAYNAEIYQYVGDEAILTWEIHDPNQHIPFIELFQAYQQKLQSKSAVYWSKYGTVPVFKAGVSKGLVAVTEIGEIKREIAFHGDALNVGSRLCGQCRIIKKDLIFNATLLPHILAGQNHQIESHGEIQVRGRTKVIDMMSLKTASAVVWDRNLIAVPQVFA